MDDAEIEKIINKEFDGILYLDDNVINNLSFAESCIYLENLNKVKERIEELKKGDQYGIK